MTDNELFKEVFDRIVGKRSILTMSGTLVCYRGEPKFNIDGFSLGYNLLRLARLLDSIGGFM